MAGVLGKAVAIATDYGIDTAMGGVGIAQAKGDAYEITGEVLGVGANIGVNLGTTAAFTGAKTAGATLAAGAATGPGIIAAVAIVVLQIVGQIIDSAWNPFKNYYNSDLDSIKESIDSQIKEELDRQRLAWPLEVKPNIYSFLSPDDPNYEKNIKEFQDNIKQYYDNNGLITTEDVLKEENIFTTILQLRRENKKFIRDENGNLRLVDPTLSTIKLQDSDNNNMLLLLSLAIYAKKKKLIKEKTNFEKIINKISKFLQFNWQIFISLLLLLSIFFSIVLL